MDERAAERPDALPSELAWRLREVEAAVSPEEIAELWVFPPLTDLEHSSEFLLFTRYLENERRRLYTARIPADVLAGDAPGAGGPRSNGGNGNGRHAPSNGNGRHVPAAERNGHGSGEDAGGKGGGGQEIRDHGTVPADRMPRFVENFLRRLDGEAGDPIHVEVNGCRKRWFSLVTGSTHGHGSEMNGRNGDQGSSSR